jgi:fructose-1,6-bisphosphatase/inositol monophosphatase family enzyme
MMNETELLRVGTLLAEAAKLELMPRFAQPSLERRQKSSSFDIVTDADEASERLITQGLLQAFPGATVVGEEGVATGRATLNALDSEPAVFVVDPLDGTMNFASGLPLFGIMVAYLEFGQVVAAAIHDPIRRDTAFALRGRGAWLDSATGERTSLRVAPAPQLNDMIVTAGTNYFAEPLRSQVRANLGRLGTSSWFRCAAHEYRLAAAGHTHVLLYNRLMPWDHAAGWLLHQEAGGYSAHFDGSPYLPSHTSGGLLCAPDEKSWLACREAIFGSLTGVEAPHPEGSTAQQAVP